MVSQPASCCCSSQAQLAQPTNPRNLTKLMLIGRGSQRDETLRASFPSNIRCSTIMHVLFAFPEVGEAMRIRSTTHHTSSHRLPFGNMETRLPSSIKPIKPYHMHAVREARSLSLFDFAFLFFSFCACGSEDRGHEDLNPNLKLCILRVCVFAMHTCTENVPSFQFVLFVDIWHTSE